MKPVALSCPSPVPPLYLDDDGLPFPTDVIQHRLRQIEAGYKQEVEQLLSFDGIEHLFILLGESVQQICSRAADSEQSMNIQLQKRLLQYVEENYTSSDLSLHTAANHIGTSIYVVSRLFKEATGKGFKDYVVDKRLDHGHKIGRAHV